MQHLRRAEFQGSPLITAPLISEGWFQNMATYAALKNSFTDSTGSLNPTNLSIGVVAGQAYLIQGALQVSNATAADGAKINFAGGTCSATTFFMAAAVVGSVVAGTVVSTALNTTINWTTTTGTDYILLYGYLLVNAGGTFILQAATNSGSTVMTMGAGSWLALAPTPLF